MMYCNIKMIRCLAIFGMILSQCSGQYTPDWDSLDSRPLPQWYDEAKIGIFIHWGVFSVPSFGSEWFWSNWRGSQYPEYVEFMENNYRPGFTYQDFASHFTAEFYDPDEWAELFEAAGAKYVVLTSKHHEGYTLWPSEYSFSWNAMDIGPNRDLLGDLANSIRNVTPGVRFGLYHSLYEWFNPVYINDKNNDFQTNEFVVSKTVAELYELSEQYAPEIIWSDGEWEAPDWYWNSTVYLSWLFNESPVKDTVVVNDRWGSNTLCEHGSFYTCTDRYNPGVLQPYKWENAMTIDKNSWGYVRTTKSDEYLTIEELLTTIIETVSCGGNILVNVGPTHDGRIPPIMEERLRQMGDWLSLNGEAIYGSNPWAFQNDSSTPGIWYTSRDEFVYATVLFWPSNETVTLGSVTPDVVPDTDALDVYLVGNTDELQVSLDDDGLTVTLPSLSTVESTWAWVLKMQGVTIP